MWSFAKHSAVVLVALFCPVLLWAQSQGVELSLRGGAGLWHAEELPQVSAGPLGGLEVAYSFRANVSRSCAAGVRVGGGFGISRASLHGTPSDTYTNYDYQGRPMLYFTQADVREMHRMLSLDIPVMGTFSFNGFSLHAGPRLVWLLSDRFDQSLSSPVIRATYTDYGVTLENKLITGLIPTRDQQQQGKQMLARGRLQLGAEAGYEWTINQGFYRQQRMAVLFFAYYDLLTFKRPWQTMRFIDVDPILSPANPVPAVHVSSLGSYAASLRSLQIGVRLSLTIETIDYQRYNWHRH